jgi:ribosomal RNA-processing protein 9
LDVAAVAWRLLRMMKNAFIECNALTPNAVQASGAGDGLIRMWGFRESDHGKTLELAGSLPARGFVNGLAIARSARFVVAAMGQEPRLGRWARDKDARNGVLFHTLTLQE